MERTLSQASFNKVITYCFLIIILLWNTKVSAWAATSAEVSSQEAGVTGMKQSEDKDAAKVEDLFTIGGKPLTVWLKPRSDGGWHFKFEPGMKGAVARVPMQDGTILDFTVKVQKGEEITEPKYSLDTKLSKEAITLTVKKLPWGKLAPVLLSEKLYGNAFRLVWEMQPDGGHRLYLIKDIEN